MEGGRGKTHKIRGALLKIEDNESKRPLRKAMMVRLHAFSWSNRLGIKGGLEKA